MFKNLILRSKALIHLQSAFYKIIKCFEELGKDYSIVLAYICGFISSMIFK